MNIRVLRSARRTIADGIRFYECQESGLGVYFLSSIMSDLRSLRIFFGSNQKFERTPFHRMVSKRFPYSIYHRIEGLDASEFAVLDDRRDPKWTKRTLGSVGLDP